MKLTVGELLDHIEKFGIPRDSNILIQRVEDKYFENKTWKEGLVMKDNDYSNFLCPEDSVVTRELLCDQYIPATQIPHYHVGGDLNIYISAHY